MNQPWPTIVARYALYTGDNAAIHEMLALAKRIATGPLAKGLYAWTSMFDLCVTQTEVEYPYDGPYLKVSPLPDGRVEFRYLDTRDHEKQWHRTVDAKDALPRMLSFLGQLHWFSVEQLQP